MIKITTPEEEKKKEATATKSKPKITKTTTAPKKETEVKPEIKSEPVPLGYITVKLDSLGKLSAPFELHFRDYSIEEVLELSSTNDDVDNLEAVIKVLNSMVHEDFDCGELTHEELLEILYSIQGNFYSRDIEKSVLIDEKADPKDKDNYTYAMISITDIKTKTLDEEFKEPFTLKDSKTGSTYTFRLPRVKDKITAEKYIRNKYKKETREFSDIHKELYRIEKIKDNDLRKEAMSELESEKYDEIRDYEEYLIGKTKLLLVLIQGLSLLSVDGGELEYGDCEELLRIIPSVSRRVWETYSTVTEKYTYGLDEEVTFWLPEAEDYVTRRLAFQRMDFLPNNDEEGDTGVSISFS